MKKKLKEKIEELKKYVEDGDDEAAHGTYDEILLILAFDAHPNYVRQIGEIVKDTAFWYA